jgi:hypothetical protein
VQARARAVPRLQCADRVSAPHGVSLLQGRDHRFVAREQAPGMRDRQHAAVDDGSGEVHRSVGWGHQLRVRGADVDPAVPGRVAVDRREERPHDRVRRGHRPQPPGQGGSGNRPGNQGENQKGTDAAHPYTIACRATCETGGVRSVRTRLAGRPVGEQGGDIVLGALCESTATTRARCDCTVAQRHPLSHREVQSILRDAVPDACRAPGSRPTGRDNN